jgi:predicted lysophospholipase L1 biosynthesis ABC-type transport system permease subunit
VQPVSPQRPAEVTNLARVDQLPFLLTGLLVLVGLATLVHTIVTSVRRNGRDLAVLKTLGFVRRQLSATVAWQATTFAVVAIAIGVPLGVAGGRWLWSLFARELGLLAEPVVVPTVVVSAAVATVAAANIAALVPARTAARVRAATVLRAE